MPGAVLDPVVVAVNELAGNAVEHADAQVVCVRWEDHDRAVQVTVEDDGTFRIGQEGYRGRGLKIAINLADEVVMRAGRPGAPGTTVRLRVGLPDRVAAHPPDEQPRPRLPIVDRDRSVRFV